jgi:hypothetical protein
MQANSFYYLPVPDLFSLTAHGKVIKMKGRIRRAKRGRSQIFRHGRLEAEPCVVVDYRTPLSVTSMDLLVD